MDRRYQYPSEVEIQKLKGEAAKRRAALKQGGCSTYSTGFRSANPAIICLCCGLGSSNPHDIRQKYCGFCHEFHSEWERDRNG